MTLSVASTYARLDDLQFSPGLTNLDRTGLSFAVWALKEMKDGQTFKARLLLEKAALISRDSTIAPSCLDNTESVGKAM